MFVFIVCIKHVILECPMTVFAAFLQNIKTFKLDNYYAYGYSFSIYCNWSRCTSRELSTHSQQVYQSCPLILSSAHSSHIWLIVALLEHKYGQLLILNEMNSCKQWKSSFFLTYSIFKKEIGPCCICWCIRLTKCIFLSDIS